MESGDPSVTPSPEGGPEGSDVPGAVPPSTPPAGPAPDPNPADAVWGSAPGAPPAYPAQGGYPPPGYAQQPGYEYPVPAGYPPAPGYPPPPGYGYPPGYTPYPYGAYAQNRPDNMGSGRFRAQGVGELLDSAFQLYRKNFVLFLTASAFLQLPFALVQFAIEWATGFFDISAQIQSSALSGNSYRSAQLQSNSAGIILLIAALNLLVVLPLAQGAMIRIAADRHLDHPVTPGDAYRAAGRRYFPMLGTLILISLLLFAAAVGGGIATGILSLIFIGIAGPGGGTLVLVIILEILLVGGAALLVFSRMCLAPVAVVLENAGGSSSLGRSIALLSGGIWRTAGTLIVGFLITVALSFGLTLLFLAIGNPVLSQVVPALFSVFTTPIMPIVVTLIYFDRRIRRESFDAEMLARSL